MTRILIGVFIMALVTYLPRMLPFAIFKKRIENRFVRSFLSYVPYAVLAAMTFPDVFFSTGMAGIDTSVTLISAAVGAGIALILAFFDRGLLIVALSAAGAAFVTEQILQLFF